MSDDQARPFEPILMDLTNVWVVFNVGNINNNTNANIPASPRPLFLQHLTSSRKGNARLVRSVHVKIRDSFETNDTQQLK